MSRIVEVVMVMLMMVVTLYDWGCRACSEILVMVVVSFIMCCIGPNTHD